ncbi:MAG: cytochrome c biogenesis protein CcdA [Planctomycetota bacterium]|nr:cytochrome c biogenesis protein CcdA [Planctomycetota bacterium]
MLCRSLFAVMLLELAVFGQIAGPQGDVLGEPGRFSASAGHVELRAIASQGRVRPGQDLHLAIEMRIAEGWHYYSVEPAGSEQFPVKAAGLDVSAGSLKVGRILWPPDYPYKTDLGDRTILNYVYEGRAVAFVSLTVPKTAEDGPIAVAVTAQGQICGGPDNVCLDLRVSATTEITIGSSSAANPAWDDEVASAFELARPAAQVRAAHAAGPPLSAADDGVAGLTVVGGLALALLAGLTLNIMPCVLPIIPLRIYSIVQMAHASRRRFVTLGLAFAAGIVLFFVALAVASAVLKMFGGGTLDLNVHFKYPAVRIGVAMVLVVLAANLFGLFSVTVPSRLAGLERDQKRHSHAAAVGMGLMMALLATPCSFAYMALAVTWAQLQPLWLGSLAIVLVGLGMAGPHAVLAAMPDMLKKLPKPGRWMELFKQAMGFLLLPAVVYLLSTLPTYGGWPFWVAAFCVVLVFGLWMWGSWLRYDAPPARKLIVRGLAAMLVAAAGLWMLPRPAAAAVKFENFNAARITEARADGRVVVVKVTAAWCTECKLLDRAVFNTSEVADEFAGRNVLAMQADVTDADSPDSRWVERHFSTTPPLTIIYPPGDGRPLVKLGRFSRGSFIKWLDDASRLR